MNSCREEFQARAKEIEGYFEFLRIAQSAELRYTDGQGALVSGPVNPEVMKTLKAAGFLLLYNLVESSMRNAIVAIFDELSTKRVTFDEARSELRRIAIANIKKHGPATLPDKIVDAATDFLTAAFDAGELFSGNVDARKIRETAEHYGFSSRTDPRKTRHGERLLEVKTNRNFLAHGEKSFAEVGRDQDSEELSKLKAQVLAFMDAIISNVDSYIANREYLAVAEPPAVSTPVVTSLVQQAAISPESAPAGREPNAAPSSRPATPLLHHPEETTESK